jgi:hypothetical protein
VPASATRTESPVKFSESTTRSVMPMRYASTVTASPRTGSRATPALRLRFFSGLSGEAPRRCAMSDATGAVFTSNGTPPMKLVAVAEKNDCWSDGARKPVLAAPRTVAQRARR